MKLTGESVWAWAQGIGLGTLFGVIIASGFAFSPEDAARFAGALVGALIAVGGAVSLYYLKESDTQKKNRSHLLKVLRAACADAKRARSYLKVSKFDELQSTCLSLSHRARRIERLFAKFQYDDALISEAAVCGEMNQADFLEEMSELDLSKDIEGSDKLFVHHLRTYLTAIDILTEKLSFDSPELEGEDKVK